MLHSEHSHSGRDSDSVFGTHSITFDVGHLMGYTEEASLDVFQDHRHPGQHISS
jgi:hypothetical protein